MAVVQPTGEIQNVALKVAAAHSVWVKRYWADAWIYVPYLEARQSDDTAAPTIATADFKWRYGTIAQVGIGELDTFGYETLQNWFIGIVVHTVFGEFQSFVGIVQDEDTDVGSNQTGNVAFGAYGTEYLLRRQNVLQAYVEGGATIIGRVPVFNRLHDRGLSNAGNRTTSRNGGGVYTFSTEGKFWTNLDILEYLLWSIGIEQVQFNPFQSPILWTITGQTEPLDQIVDVYDFDGSNYLDAVNALINRRRGLGWRVITTGEGVLELNVFSILPYEVQLGEVSIPANQNLDDFLAEELVDIKPRISTSMSNRFDQVLVRGERISTCMTVQFSDFTLEEGWSESEQTTYEAATDKERTTDKHQRVFAFFRISRDWDWTFGGKFANPLVNEDGTVDHATQNTSWNQGHRFQNDLPLLVETDDATAEPEYRRMFVIVEDPEDDKSHYVHELGAADLSEYSVRAASREFGIVIRGRINHLFGLNAFSEAADTEFPPEIDYTTMQATVFFQTDAHLQVQFSVAGPDSSGVGKTLLLVVPDAHYWWMADGTVTDVTDGVPDVQSGDVTLRDDGPRLRAIAVGAASWYAQQRGRIGYKHNGLAPFHPVGTVIRAFGNVEIGTAITRRTFNYVTGMLEVQTGYAELDKGVFRGS